MTKAYRITGWHERYEVTDKGAEAKPNTPTEKLKKRPLQYIRLKIWGHNTGPAWRELIRQSYYKGAGMDLAAFGLFCKLLELAGDQERPYRGWILDHKQRPMDAESIQRTLGISDLDVVKTCLSLLTDAEVDWVEFVKFPASQTFPEMPGVSGGSQSLMWDAPPPYREVPPNLTEPNLTETETKTEKDSLEIFRLAYEIYPGTKRGCETEFNAFFDTHKDWTQSLFLLRPAIESQVKSRQICRNEKRLVCEWKTFTNWLAGRCWEEVTEADRRQDEEKKRLQRQEDESAEKKQAYLDQHRGFIMDCEPQVLVQRCQRDSRLNWAVYKIRPEVFEPEVVG